MEIRFKKLAENAVVPTRAHATDAGADLVCTRITTEINECGQLILVYHTDIAVEIPEGYCGILVPRSSIFKKSLVLTNCAGIIDSDYRGEIMAKFKTDTDVIPSVYKEKERFAQLLIVPVACADFVEAESLSESNRGENGYGSTGTTEIASAPTGSEGSLEDKSMLIDHQTAPDGSGWAQSGPEQV